MIYEKLKHLFPVCDSIPKCWYRISLESKNDTDGIIWYTIHGKSYESTENFCKVLGFSDENTVIWMLKFGAKLPKTYRDGY